MKIHLPLLAFLFSCAFGFAQDDSRLAKPTLPLPDVQRVNMPQLDNKALLSAELESRRPGRAPSFAKAIEVNINPNTHGNWEVLDNGNAVWRVRIYSPTAKSLNFGFSQYMMPQGGTLVLYSPDYSVVRGPFTPADNEEHEQLWTPLIDGEELVIEVQLPQAKRNELKLNLDYVNHDFLGFTSIQSGSCNLDVICGADDGWEIVDGFRDIIQSVSMYTLSGTQWCTGFLVNNTRQDCTPLFMTANHCVSNAANGPAMVAFWNYQSPVCREPGSAASGGNGNGSLDDFNSGMEMLATYAPTDMSIFQLDDPVSETANAFFAGWDITNIPAESAVAIHHPNTDEKRISFEDDPLHPGDWGSGDAMVPGGNHIVVPDWDIGTTEPGSSGSPLYDFTTKRAIGQLHGGGAACGNDQYDIYGWFAFSWEGGGTPGTRLKDWLDPDDTGATAIDGRWALACSFFVDAEPTSYELCDLTEVTYNLTTSENFTEEVNLTVAGLPDGVTATFTENPVMPGGTTSLTVTGDGMTAAGNYTIVVTGTGGADMTETELTLTVFGAAPEAVALEFPADGAENVSLIPNFMWENALAGSTYNFEVATDPDFMNIVDMGSGLTDAEFMSTMLSDTTQYFWRVQAENICGASEWSPASSFTTAFVICSAAASTDIPIEIGDGAPAEYTSTLQVFSQGAIIDLNVVDLIGTHTWVGDLTFTLTSPSGTTVTLVSELCEDLDDFNINFDSDAESGDIPCPYVDGGTYRPSGSLADFNGEEASGVWTLTVADGANQDGGVLEGWALDFCIASAGNFNLLATEEEISTCVGEPISFDVVVGEDFAETGATLSADDLPDGATVTFSENPAAPGSTVTVTISDVPAGTNGTFTVLLAGVDENLNNGFGQIVLNLNDAPVSTDLFSPTDGEIDVAANTNLTWAASNATEYLVEISTDADFMNIVDAATQSGTAYATNLALATDYFWRVSATNECGTSVSEVFSFTTLTDLSFTASVGDLFICTSDEVSFLLTVGQSFDAAGAQLSAVNLPGSSTATFADNPVLPGSTTEVTLSNFTGTPVGNYTVVFTADDGTNISETSVEVDIDDAPDVANLQSPADGAMMLPTLPSFTWDAADGATFYTLEIASDDSFSAASVVQSIDVNGTSFDLTEELEVGTYFWRVSTQNDCGGSTSLAFSFTVEPSSIEDLNGVAISLLPNPTNGLLYIDFSAPFTDEVIVELFTIDGKRLQQQVIQSYSTNQTLDLSAYASGIYLVKLVNQATVATERIVLQR